MKVLFATTNLAKINYYAEELIRKGMTILTLNDLKLSSEIEEDGKDPVESAIVKAKSYYNISKITTVAMEDRLYIEGLEEALQPNINFRKVNGKRLEDNEMIEYYSNLVKKLGGKAGAKWIKGVAIYSKGGLKTLEYSKVNFWLVDKPSREIKEGYPLDSLTMIPEFNKYLTDLTWEEYELFKKQNNSKSILDFIIKNV